MVISYKFAERKGCRHVIPSFSQIHNKYLINLHTAIANFQPPTHSALTLTCPVQWGALNHFLLIFIAAIVRLQPYSLLQSTTVPRTATQKAFDKFLPFSLVCSENYKWRNKRKATTSAFREIFERNKIVGCHCFKWDKIFCELILKSFM